MLRELTIIFKKRETECGKRLVISNIIEVLKKLENLKIISFSGTKIKIETSSQFNKGKLIDTIKNIDKQILRIDFVEFYLKSKKKKVV